MTGDPYIDELRQFRDSFAARCGNDVEMVAREIETRHHNRIAERTEGERHSDLDLTTRPTKSSTA